MRSMRRYSKMTLTRSRASTPSFTWKVRHPAGPPECAVGCSPPPHLSHRPGSAVYESYQELFEELIEGFLAQHGLSAEAFYEKCVQVGVPPRCFRRAARDIALPLIPSPPAARTTYARRAFAPAPCPSPVGCGQATKEAFSDDAHFLSNVLASADFGTFAQMMHRQKQAAKAAGAGAGAKEEGAEGGGGGGRESAAEAEAEEAKAAEAEHRCEAKDEGSAAGPGDKAKQD